MKSPDTAPQLLLALNQSVNNVSFVEDSSKISSKRLWILDENINPEFLSAVTLPKIQLDCLTNRVDLHRACVAHGFTSFLSDFDLAATAAEYESIVFRIAKEKLLTYECIDNALRWLAPSGELVLIGEKHDGIKSVASHIEAVYQTSVELKKLGSTYRARIKTPTALSSTKLGADKLESNKLESAESHTTLANGRYRHWESFTEDGFTFVSKPGVFGWNKIDRGSRLLIDTLAATAQRDQPCESLLDLGCGWGYLTLALRHWPAAVRVATDNNITAVAACSKNCVQHQLDVEVVADDCAASITRQFSHIVCNPPFHHGFSIESELLVRFVSSVKRLLQPLGVAYFVVNQFIPLPRIAASLALSCECLSDAHGFKVYLLAHRPARSR